MINNTVFFTLASFNFIKNLKQNSCWRDVFQYFDTKRLQQHDSEMYIEPESFKSDANLLDVYPATDQYCFLKSLVCLEFNGMTIALKFSLLF